jgi:hypothetical protein
MAGPSITSANASINLTIPGVFSQGVLLQQFSTDDIIDPEPQELTEASVGADGFVVAGYVFNLNNFRLTFQPNSASIAVFYQWKAAQDSLVDVIAGSMKIIAPSLDLDVDLTDVFCKSLPFLPPLKKVAGSLSVAMTANPLWQTTSTV